ncbi:MAG: response regulator, partial [Candidatus Rokubacteria bacterium]|nr:response regulator [Candidatus Rokubacteria bacterium]
TQQGHVVLAAADGREGIAVAQREPLDLVFTDLAVPEASGLEVGRALKRIRPGTPVVLITAWPGRLDPATLEEAGIDRVIEKPVGAPEVLAVLEATLAARRATRP